MLKCINKDTVCWLKNVVFYSQKIAICHKTSMDTYSITVMSVNVGNNYKHLYN